jgi:hypothetical protein
MRGLPLQCLVEKRSLGGDILLERCQFEVRRRVIVGVDLTQVCQPAVVLLGLRQIAEAPQVGGDALQGRRIDVNGCIHR